MTNLFAFHFCVELIIAIFWSCWAATFLATGNTVSDTALILASFFVAQAIFEVPTGYWADRYGRKLFTILGLLFVAAGFAFVGISNQVSDYIAGFFVAGFGLTMMSGAKAAWLLSLGRKLSTSGLKTAHDNRRFFLHLHLVGRLATILGAFGGVEILKRDPHLFWQWVAALSIFVAGFGLFVNTSKQEFNNDKSPTSKFQVSPLMTEFKNPILLLAFGSALFFGIEAGIRNLIYQPFILEISNGNQNHLAYFQGILAVLRLAGILAYMGLGLSRRNRLSAVLLCSSLFWFGLSEVLSAQIYGFWTFVIVYGSAVFSLGWYFPLREQFLNSIVSDRLRATLISADSMLMNLASAFALVFLFRENFSSVRDYWWMAGIALFISGTLLTISLVQSRKTNVSPA